MSVEEILIAEYGKGKVSMGSRPRTGQKLS